MKGSRAGALLVGVTAALTLAACGVPPSDVIEAGEPAGGMSSTRPEHSIPTVIPVYFLHNGELKAHFRKVGEPGDYAAVVGLLFDGPSKDEAVTTTTDLPRLTAKPAVTVGSDNIVSIRLTEALPPFGHLAMLQLACTVAQVSSPFTATIGGAGQGNADMAPSPPTKHFPAPTSVRVFGDGWTTTQPTGSCPGPGPEQS
ncbi:hypothetical protein ACWEQ2_10735 [Streptomyces sp. NPDC004096]|uniref:hypothetical protein n=1 Tax=Streptomyces sp. NPDC057746 TaxID=3346237 RepID=UPI0036920952